MSTDEHDLVSDADLLARLNRLLGDADPVPDAVAAAARASLGWRGLDAELARLVEDSLAGAGAVRGGDSRLLTFEAGELTLEIEVDAVGGRLRVVGQVVPPQVTHVRVEQPGGDVRVSSDEVGRFAVADLPPGPTRLVCTRPGAEAVPVCTEWTVL